METNHLLKISEFADLTGVSRKLLIFYDKRGIMHPQFIDSENGYRYYSYRQIETMNIIIAFREAGMPLECIRNYLEEKSPENLIDVLCRQEQDLESKIEKLKHIRGMVKARKAQTLEGMSTKVGDIFLKEYTDENLFLGPELPYTYDTENGFDYLPDFYRSCKKNGLQFGFYVGKMISKKNLETSLWRKPSNYFYRLPTGEYPDFFTKPAGLYVVGSDYADYGDTDFLYKKLFSFIHSNHLRICGNSYEEYLIDEFAEKRPNRYLNQIQIQITQL